MKNNENPSRNCDYCTNSNVITETDEDGNEKCIFCQIKDGDLPEPDKKTEAGDINRLHPDNDNVMPEM